MQCTKVQGPHAGSENTEIKSIAQIRLMSTCNTLQSQQVLQQNVCCWIGASNTTDKELESLVYGINIWIQG